MKWLRISLLIQIILEVYFQVVLWFPLGSWNDQPGKRLITVLREGHALAVLGFSLAMRLPLLLFALAFWKRWVWVMWLGLIGYGVGLLFRFRVGGYLGYLAQISALWTIRSFSKGHTSYSLFPLDTLHPTRCTSFWISFSSWLS
jgi:hypothetical protein